jgi:DNA primase
LNQESGNGDEKRRSTNDEYSQPEQMSMSLKSFAKTGGSEGLQVCVPLNTSVTYDETKKLSRALPEDLEGEHVDLVTSNMSKAVRKGKVFGHRETQTKTAGELETLSCSDGL